MKIFIKKNWLKILGLILGAIGGYLYWYYVGCLTGTCPLKKMWYYDVLFGGLIGLFLVDIVQSLVIKTKKKKENEKN